MSDYEMLDDPAIAEVLGTEWVANAKCEIARFEDEVADAHGKARYMTPEETDEYMKLAVTLPRL